MSKNKESTKIVKSSTLGKEVDQEISNMLQEHNPSVAVTMPADEEPRLKVFDENGKELADHDIKEASKSGATVISGQNQNTATPAPKKGEVKADDSKVMGDSNINQEGTTAISGLDKRTITPMRKSGFSVPNLANMSPEDRAIMEKFTNKQPKAKPETANTQATSTLDAETQVMDGSDVNQAGTTAISGLDKRTITPMKKSGFSAPNLANMSPEDRAIMEKFTNKQPKAKPETTNTQATSTLDAETQVMGGSDVNQEGTTAISGLDKRTITPMKKSGFSAPNLANMSPQDRAIMEKFIKRPAKPKLKDDETQVMDGSNINVDGTTAIIGLENRNITPVKADDNTLLNRSFDNTGSYRMEPRSNETHMQTGSSHIVRNNDAKTNSNILSQINNATVSEEGTTAISGLNNRPVLAEVPDSSTVITGSGANFIERQDNYDDFGGLVAPVYPEEEDIYVAPNNAIVEPRDNSLEQAPQEPTYGYDDVMAMPAEVENVPDEGPQYLVGPQDQDNDDSPYQFGTYANKLAYNNERRHHEDKEPFYQPRSNNNSNKNKDDGPYYYYGTYASQLERQNNAQYDDGSYVDHQSAQEYPDNELQMADNTSEEETFSPEPAGMGDGALSQLNLKNYDSAMNDAEGPVYYVGPKETAPQAESDNGPIYAVGVNSKNADAMASLQAARSKINHNRNADYGMEEPLSEEEAVAYEQALAEAARESMAAPQSEVVKRARMLAAQEEYLPEESTLDLEGAASTNVSLANDEQLVIEERQKELNAEQRREDNGQYNFANMPDKTNVGFGMMICLYIRQLCASFFTHTTLPILAPKLALRLGPCYPSSMPIPFFVVGFIAGALGSMLYSTLELEYIGALPYLIYLLLTGLTGYHGIYRMCTFIKRKRHDLILLVASVMVPMLIFVWLSNTLIVVTQGIVEATAAFAIASMLSAATASSLTWNFPQDPMDSCGSMSTKGLLFVVILSLMAAFGLLHYTVGLSVLGVGLVMRLLFGYLIAKNQGTAQRSYVYALQLLTLFAILLDFILLKSQNYEFLSQSSLELVTYLRAYSQFF